jgi:hypothetical protein
MRDGHVQTFQTPSAGLKARKVIAQGKRDKVRVVLGYVPENISKPCKRGRVSKLRRKIPFLMRLSVRVLSFLSPNDARLGDTGCGNVAMRSPRNVAPIVRRMPMALAS